jgi:carbon-monoxide dehydrogenase medium subunit
MKPVAFGYERPKTIDEASRLLAAEPGAKVIAGGQTLGPMLNLRLAQPDLLVDVTRIAELARVDDDGDAIVLGACITHAAIEDRRVPDVTNGCLPAVARGIAYRAVRARGTVGGSLAHADPAADWLSCFAALGAEVLISGPGGRRRIGIREFVRGAMHTDLRPGEMVDGVRVPKLSKRSRTGFYKLCRKTGEFAEAIGMVVFDSERGHRRFVAGATGGAPIVIDDVAGLFRGGSTADLPPPAAFDVPAAGERLKELGLGDDAYELRIHAVALKRALERAHAP